MKPSWKRIVIIAAIALASAGAIACLVIFLIVPAARYGKADTLLDKGDTAGAYDAWDRMGDYRDADDRKAKLQNDIIATRTAESMKFGGMDWLVLEEKDGKALLLLKEVLDPRPFNEARVETSWEACTLRLYLNGPFYESLDEADRARVVETTLINGGNAESGVKAAGETTDHVFLLSVQEAKLYFPTDASRVAYNSRGTAAYWWLRSPGFEPILATTVGSNGAIAFVGSGVDYTTRCVRPAVWVTL